MDKQGFLKELIFAQDELNRLLMYAGALQLMCKVTVNKVNCYENDERQVVGLTVTSTEAVYTNDGVP